MVELVISEVVRFFDGDADGCNAHSASMNSLFGEELALALLEKALCEQGYHQVEVLDAPCTQGMRKGKWLDCWIAASAKDVEVLFQVEIKNWGAHSLKGQSLALDSDATTLAVRAKQNWARYWDATNQMPAIEKLQKVLLPMRVPAGYANRKVCALACVWDVLHPHGTLESWFTVPCSGAFNQLHWFSVSAYLRTLHAEGKSRLQVAMPELEARLDWVRRMFDRAD